MMAPESSVVRIIDKNVLSSIHFTDTFRVLLKEEKRRSNTYSHIVTLLAKSKLQGRESFPEERGFYNAVRDNLATSRRGGRRARDVPR